ncbi:MAG: hypothetical protein QGG40_15855, partial [Myxococcota bacterium]|nr:hypothetical protein [Myxococcota bacterium]
APFAWRFQSTLYRTDSLIDRADIDLASVPALNTLSNDVLIGLLPGQLSNLNSASFSTFYHVVYPGFVPLALALALLFLARGRAHAGVWLILGSVGWVLSFGPRLFTWRSVMSGMITPWETASVLLPLFDQIWFPYRFVVLSQLALAVLAAKGLTQLRDRLPRRFARMTPAIVPLVVLELITASALPWPRPMARVDPPEYLEQIPSVEEGAAVLDLPYPEDDLGHQMCVSRYAMHQTWHQLAIPYYVNFSRPPSRIHDTAFMTLIREARWGTWTELQQTEFKTALDDFYELGFRRIVVHTDLYSRYPDVVRRTEVSDVLTLLDACCPRIAVTETSLVYKVPLP